MHILYDIDQSYRQGNNNGIQYCPVHDTANANHYRLQVGHSYTPTSAIIME